MQNNLIQETIKPIPAFAHLAGRTVTCTPSRSLRRRMRTPETLTISQWAERYRRVTEIDAKPGPWRNELVPHLIKVMDTIGQPWVRETWICAPERSGKTQLLINTVAWSIDQGSSSGNIFWLMPTEADARKALGERIIPVFRAKDDHGRPGRIARYLTTLADDTTRGMIRFNHGIRLFPAWANSPASMASYFGRINIADECDKFPDRTSEGSDPITLFRKRARDDRHRSKYIYASTPAGKFIYKGVMSCHQVWSYRLRCPDCGDYVQPGSEHLIIPEGATADQVERNGCEIACPACASVWNEDRRRTAYHAGRWIAIKGADDTRPSTVGWHLTAYCLPSIPLGETAASWMRAKIGDLSAKIAYANGYEAIDYEAGLQESNTTDNILRHKSDLPRNAVPLGAAMLIMAADTQQDHFYYEIHSIGYAPGLDMHMVRHGIVQKFSDIEYILNEEVFTDADGKEFSVQSGLIDSGGTRKRYQKHSRTVQVYDWCLTQPKMSPFKGIPSRRDGSMIAFRPVETYPGTNKRLPGGLIRIDAKVDYFKDELARRLAIEPDDPGAVSFHSEIDEGFAKHYCAEGKTETGEWEHDTKLGRNDYFDCHVYAFVLREILKTRIPRRPDEIAAKRDSKPKPVTAKPRRW